MQLQEGWCHLEKGQGGSPETAKAKQGHKDGVSCVQLKASGLFTAQVEGQLCLMEPLLGGEDK